jgi:RimJ/RimL family protein N-acetyltransferase
MKDAIRPLEGPYVRLVPLGEHHSDSVVKVALAHPEVWEYMPFAMGNEDEARASLLQALALQEEGRAIFYVMILRESSELVGGTAILSVDPRVPSFEVGPTWIVPRHQRTRVNTEAKSLQLAFAFETLGAARVELKADVRNERSRTAIARIGARCEGVLRSHMRRANGSLGDYAMFSIVEAEWPSIKSALEAKLSTIRPAQG